MNVRLGSNSVLYRLTLKRLRNFLCLMIGRKGENDGLVKMKQVCRISRGERKGVRRQ